MIYIHPELGPYITIYPNSLSQVRVRVTLYVMSYDKMIQLVYPVEFLVQIDNAF